MFKNVDVVKVAEQTALPEAERDRLQFLPVYQAIESYARDEGLFVGGTMGLLMLLQEPLSIDDYMYELYSAKPRRDARALADRALAANRERTADRVLAANRERTPNPFAEFVSLVPQLPGAEYHLFVETRLLCKVRLLPAYRGGHIADVVRPVQRESLLFPGTRLKCFGPDIQLIRVYRGLTDLMRAKEWPDLAQVEKRLRASVLGATGGAARNQKARSQPTPDRKAVDAALKVASAGPRVVVGDITRAPEDGQGRRAQVVSQFMLQREEEEFREGMAKEMGVAPGTFEVKYDEIHIPGERHIRRLTFYLRLRERRQAFLDIFNIANHSLVSFEWRSIRGYRLKVGTPYIQLFVAMVDVWTMQLLFRIGAVDESFAKRRGAELLASVQEIGETVDQVIAEGALTASLPAMLFPPDSEQYIGYYEDPVLLEKRANAAARERPGTPREFPYYPAKKH